MQFYEVYLSLLSHNHEDAQFYSSVSKTIDPLS